MLEKIGLPSKPSMRGGNWVVDASHCQGCSSQFTFINRKHHCRRCGGLFCNSCTQQRMILRGQGDSPVRICDPCKKLEDAARFELRYGKNRAAKGNSKQVQSQEEEILHQILGTDGKLESHADMTPDVLRSVSSASSSSLKEDSPALGREGGSLIDTGANSPEDLRRQAIEEKEKYRILKGKGKSAEALQFFKRSKELERQAAALEIALRKNRRMASRTSNLSTVISEQKKDDFEESSNKKKLPSQKGEEEKGDLAAELRELGWSDADLHHAEKKPVNLSLEGELSNLLGEISHKPSSSRKAGSIDKSQVVALKKKALQLKREGKLAEAKEELKSAKILEKQLEEQELLGDSEDSDDELSALIRSMDNDKHDDLQVENESIPGIKFNNFFNVGDELTIDDNFDVTDNDMNDPELGAALKSFGWTEEDDEQVPYLLDSNPLDREALQHEVLTLKKEALTQKREGNVAEAMALLKKAKLLEKDLETIQVDGQQTFAPEVMPKSSTSQFSSEKSGHQATVKNDRKLPAKSKLAIQKELLALKKKALALRREGRVEEADEELKKGEALEQQLEEMETASKRPAPKMSTKNLEMNIRTSDFSEEGEEAEVTEQDLHDPAMMSVLKNLGWDDDGEPANLENNKLHETPIVPRRSKAEIQRELLSVKRKALALRRQGKTEEAEEELERAKELEKQLADIEASSTFDSVPSSSQGKSDSVPIEDEDSPPLLMGRKIRNQEIDSKGNNQGKPLPHTSVSVGKPGPQLEERTAKTIPSTSPFDGEILQSKVERAKADNSPEQNTAHVTDTQKEKVLAHKRKAVALKREGKLSEAREELRHAKLLENSPEGGSLQSNAMTSTVSAPATEATSVSVVQESRTNQQAQKPLSSRDRFKLQQESLAHKRNALKLRREGKIDESEAELELAKALESQLEESSNQGSSTRAHSNDVGVEDLFDPQLLSALKSIGWEDNELSAQPSKKLEPKTNSDKSGNFQGERSHLEEMIKAEKIKALNLKREGKQAEALEALRSAKRLERKLGSLTQ
ncbi:uncharacterized protein A4U43_C05F32840 [Asparagus officinalis]|uniref:FYVE-type domain-containing protein n=1 Tax=Asparagus officinalis TaxID=4686 RepID=A0A5P1EWR8_ASPOF|nr:uncharacterized protein LOC109841147 [Asparagus officinalis]XP_020265614.1 uncharacterized protein LOC109841147 [Asparagus officinalis]ONK70352.1 uncharacterized protein A4U43_C05F32840 [Asparagus officinalis]